MEPTPDAFPGNAEVRAALLREALARDQQVLSAIKEKLPELTKLQEEFNSQWGYEDPIYRYYYGSFKVYGLHDSISRAVSALKEIGPTGDLCQSFTRLTDEAMKRRFTPEANCRWDQETAILVEAFLHAKYFIDMAVKYGGELESAPQSLPSGWAALLCLYGIR